MLKTRVSIIFVICHSLDGIFSIIIMNAIFEQTLSFGIRKLCVDQWIRVPWDPVRKAAFFMSSFGISDKRSQQKRCGAWRG